MTSASAGSTHSDSVSASFESKARTRAVFTIVVLLALTPVAVVVCAIAFLRHLLSSKAEASESEEAEQDAAEEVNEQCEEETALFVKPSKCGVNGSDATNTVDLIPRSGSPDTVERFADALVQESSARSFSATAPSFATPAKEEDEEENEEDADSSRTTKPIEKVTAAVSDLSAGRATTSDRRTVLVTGGKMTKSLHFARWFAKAGYRVVLIETPKYWHVGARASRAVSAFAVVPDPRTDPAGYVDGLVRVALEQKADLFVPVSSPPAALHDATAGERMAAHGCRALHFTHAICSRLDDKHAFCEWASRELGLRAPETVLLQRNDDVRSLNASLRAEVTAAAAAGGAPRKFILKNLTYDSAHRLDLFTLPCEPAALEAYLATLTGPFEITPTSPWQAQRFLEGNEFTAFAVVREGVLRAFTVSASSASQLNYEHIDHPQIEQWVTAFAARTRITGQLCWDFVEDVPGGEVYPIECNPRIHTQCSVFLTDPRFGNTVLDDDVTTAAPGAARPARPPAGAAPVFWWYNELFKVLMPSHYGRGEGGLPGLLELARTQTEAQLADGSDPLPFLVANHVQIPLLLLGQLARGNPWKKVDFAIGKLVEVNGD